MKFYSLTCDCGCSEPLIAMSPDKRHEAIVIYRSKETAEIAATELRMSSTNKQPLVKEFEVKEIK